MAKKISLSIFYRMHSRNTMRRESHESSETKPTGGGGGAAGGKMQSEAMIREKITEKKRGNKKGRICKKKNVSCICCSKKILPLSSRIWAHDIYRSRCFNIYSYPNRKKYTPLNSIHVRCKQIHINS